MILEPWLLLSAEGPGPTLELISEESPGRRGSNLPALTLNSLGLVNRPAMPSWTV
jgi:hypothetical protein